MPLPPNIILIGFMGSGKTTTGKELSKILGFRFWDMDQWIEERNSEKVAEIFSKKGEKFFRRQESEAIRWLTPQRKYVVSIGGGAWLQEANRKKLLKMGWCIWLKVTARDAWRRVKGHVKQRPILSKAENPLHEIECLLDKREPFYALAHASIDTSGKNSKEIALEIARNFKEGRPFDLPEL